MKKSIVVSLLLIGFTVAGRSDGQADARDKNEHKQKSLTYVDIIKIRDGKGAEGQLGPIARIVSPLADARVAPGDGRIGAGSFNGAGFALNLEVVTRDRVPVAVNESLNIRDTALLGQANPNFPGLYVFFDTDLTAAQCECLSHHGRGRGCRGPHRFRSGHV